MRSLFALFAFAARMARMPHGTAKAGLEEGRAAYARADYGAALNELMPLAKAGNAHAQRMLGILYRQGQGVAKNAERALHWTQEAVKQGDAGAQYRLGVFYLEDIGGTRDVVRAFVWFSRAAANERGGGLKAHAAKARDKVAQHLNDKDKARGAALLKQKSTQPKATPSKPKKQSAGTEFIVSADGYILTNNHMVAGCREVRIKPLKVRVVAQDPKSDLALLKVSANFKRFATFRDGAVRKGEGVVVN